MDKDLSNTSLKQLIQNLSKREAGLVQGVVISTDPLRVQMVNDSKLIVSRISTVVPKHLTNYTVSAQVADQYGQRSATITVLNALTVGDRVHLLALQNGKKYFVLDRV